MKNNILRKLISLFLVLSVIATGFSACKKEADLGIIKDIDLAVSEEEASEKNTFIKYESPFDYEYTKIYFRKANMELDMPADWGISAVNSRYLSILTPKDDPYLPGITINILASYGTDVETDEYSVSTNNDNTMYFSNLFKDELPGLTFMVNGRRAHLRKYYSEDAIHNGLDFAGGEGSREATTLEVDTVTLIDSGSNYIVSECGMLTTYLKWDHSAYCIATVAPKEYMQNARAMIEYMASSITYLPYPSEGCRRVKYEDFSMELPNSFTSVENASNIFISDMYDNASTAGMSVSVMRADGYEAGEISDEVILDSLCPRVGELAYNYGLKEIRSFDVQESTSGSDFTGLMIISPGVPINECAGCVYGSTDMYAADYYIVTQGDYIYILSFIYHDRQTELAKKIEERALNTFTVRKAGKKKS